MQHAFLVGRCPQSEPCRARCLLLVGVNRQTELLLWMLTSVFQPQKKTAAKTREGWNVEILCGTKSSEIFPFWMNKNVSFTFGLTLTCSYGLSWSCISSLLSLATCGPGLSDCTCRMQELQPRPEAAEAPVGQAQVLGNHNSIRLLVIPAMLLMFWPVCFV